MDLETGYFLIYVLSILLSSRKRGRWALEGGVVSSSTAPAGRPDLMSLKKNYLQLIIMFILFSDYQLSNSVTTVNYRSVEGWNLVGMIVGNLLLQFI